MTIENNSRREPILGGHEATHSSLDLALENDQITMELVQRENRLQAELQEVQILLMSRRHEVKQQVEDSSL